MKKYMLHSCIVLLCAVFIAVTFTACSSAAGQYTSEAAAAIQPPTEHYDNAASASDATVSESESGLSITMPADTERKIHFSADVRMESKEFDSLLSGLSNQAIELGGYVSESRLSGNSEERNRYASVTFQIPTENYQQFMNTLGSMGNIVEKNEYGEDLTITYHDTETRLKTLLIQEERILELLEQADTMEDILSIEQRLSEIRYEKEYLTTTMNELSSLVSYATIRTDVYEVGELTEQQEGIGYLFADSFGRFGNFLANIGKVLIYIFPYLILAGIIVAVVIVIARGRRRKNPGRPKPPHPNGYYVQAPAPTPPYPDGTMPPHPEPEKNPNEEQNR